MLGKFDPARWIAIARPETSKDFECLNGEELQLVYAYLKRERERLNAQAMALEITSKMFPEEIAVLLRTQRHTSH